MKQAQAFGIYDQGFFNTACQLAQEITNRTYLNFLCELDATGMDELRQRMKDQHRPAPTYTAFVVKAAAQALRMHPHLNCMIKEGLFRTRLVPLDNVTATVAVERMVDNIDMVFAPMLPEPDTRSLADLTGQLRVFATARVHDIPEFSRFRTLTKWAYWLPNTIGKIFRMSSYSETMWKKFRGGSFAVTSPGKYGGCDQVLPPWPWPLTFSFGAVKIRPWVQGQQVVPRKTMRLTITVDRRLANGAPLARFAETMRNLLEQPESMVSTLEAPANEAARRTAPSSATRMPRRKYSEPVA